MCVSIQENNPTEIKFIATIIDEADPEPSLLIYKAPLLAQENNNPVTIAQKPIQITIETILIKFNNEKIKANEIGIIPPIKPQNIILSNLIDFTIRSVIISPVKYNKTLIIANQE